MDFVARPVKTGTLLTQVCQWLAQALNSNPDYVRRVAGFIADQSVPNHRKFVVLAIHGLEPLFVSAFTATANSHTEAQAKYRALLREQGCEYLKMLSCRPEMKNLTV